MCIFFGAFAAVAVIVAGTIITAGIGTAVAGITGVLGLLVSGIASTGILIINVASLGLAAVAGLHTINAFSGNNLPDITMLPLFAIGPEEIFEGKIAAFDVNFFHPKEVWVEFAEEDGKSTEPMQLKEYNEYIEKNPTAKASRFYYYNEEGEQVDTSRQNTAMDLSATISKWYYTIRNIAVVVMMLILLYIGIRMMLCSIASEKSKYKKMLGDWVVSMCLVFLLHYIMVFAVNINEKIVEMITDISEKRTAYFISLKEKENDDDKNGMDADRKKSFIKSLYKTTGTEYNENYVGEDGKVDLLNENDDPNDHVDEIQGFVWFTNLVGQIRLAGENMDGTTEYIGYTIAYLVLVFYTVFFAFTYIKRVVYMAFLTIIAPFVAMTYSIDKIADGKAQAFDMWLKEYIFNLLIQPLHLILYVILISMSYDLASRSVIYTLVAIGFMMPAEKFVRKMFGFEKAQTPGFLGGAAGAALTMSAMKNLAHFAGRVPGPKGGDKTTGGLDKGKDESDSISGNGIDFLADGINNENGINSNGTDGSATGGNNPGLGGGGTSGPGINGSSFGGGASGTGGNNPGLGGGASGPGINGSSFGGGLPNSGVNGPSLGGGNPNQGGSGNNARHQIRFAGVRNGINKAKAFGSTVSNSKAGRAAKWTARQVAQNQNTIAKTIKTGTRLTGAIVGAGLGAAVGIASGDITKVGQNIAIGASAGDSIGEGISNRAGKAALAVEDKYKEKKEMKEREKYGENYAAHVREEKAKELMKDKETRRYIANERSSELDGLKGKAKQEKIDEMMNQYAKYVKETGVTDKKIIASAMKLDSKNPTSYESMTAALMASKAKDIKGLEPYQKRLAKKVGDAKASEIADKAADIKGFYK